jgi:hypothetical protein
MAADILSMTQREAHDYRIELLNALYVNPGSEFETHGKEGEEDRELYKAQLEAVDIYLKTFPVQI